MTNTQNKSHLIVIAAICQSNLNPQVYAVVNYRLKEVISGIWESKILDIAERENYNMRLPLWEDTKPHMRSKRSLVI